MLIYILHAPACDLLEYKHLSTKHSSLQRIMSSRQCNFNILDTSIGIWRIMINRNRLNCHSFFSFIQHLTRYVWQSPLVDNHINMIFLQYTSNNIHILLRILEVTNRIKAYSRIGTFYHHVIGLLKTYYNNMMAFLYKGISECCSNYLLTSYLEDLH